jgi:AraC-like DNA-binding protein
MLYSFAAVPGRRIFECVPNLWVNPACHPDRIMDVHDIFYMTEGQWSVLLEDEKIRARPGDIVCLPAAVAHHGLEPCMPKTRTIFVHFSMERQDKRSTDDSLKDMPEDFVVAPLTHDNGTVLPLFRNMAKIFQSNVPYREPRCRAFLDLLLAELADIYRGEIAKRDTVITELVEYITDHPDKFFSVAELAAKVKIGERSLVRRFRAETGKSVHRYQLDYKLDRVANLLKTRYFTGLKNLALNFGFCDEFHLSCSFKKKFGVSPGRFWRNK